MRAYWTFVLIAFIGLGSLAAATQTVASAFRFHPALGAPLVRFNEGAIYWPWSILPWSQRWANFYPRVFAIGHLILVAGASSGVVIVAALGNTGVPRLRRLGADGWARFEDVAAARLFAERGVVLGRFEGEVLAYGGPEHHLLIGASRSGKGRGHVVPTLLAWPHAALVLDVKGELADGDGRQGFVGTAGFRQKLGDVLRFAPTTTASARFNPLFEVRRGVNEVRDVQNIVEIIVDPAGDGRHEDFWDRSAKQILTGLILHVLYAEPEHRKTLAVVREKLRDLDGQCNLMRVMLHRRNPITGAPETHPEVLHAAESYLAGEERMRSGVKATAESFFGLFADPLVAANTSTSDFRVGDLMCGARPLTLFLQPPPSDAARLMPLMRLLLNQIVRALMETQERDATGRPKHHELLLALDEFPQLGRLAFFETAMGAFAGYGLKAYLVCQSLNHIARAYGRDAVIVDNCHIITSFAAADMETAKRIAAMAGERWQIIEQESVARPRALLGPRRGSATYREERRPLLLPGDVRQLPKDEELIFVAGCPPIRAQKLKFDQEPIFRKRLCASDAKQAPLSTGHDWAGVRPFGRLVKKEKGALVVEPMREAQAELFGDLTISERALAGLRRAPSSQQPAPPRATGI